MYSITLQAFYGHVTKVLYHTMKILQNKVTSHVKCPCRNERHRSRPIHTAMKLVSAEDVIDKGVISLGVTALSWVLSPLPGTVCSSELLHP